MALAQPPDLLAQQQAHAPWSGPADCFSRLPDECLLQIFNLLGLEDKLHSSQVCPRWTRLLRQPEAWALTGNINVRGIPAMTAERVARMARWLELHATCIPSCSIDCSFSQRTQERRLVVWRFVNEHLPSLLGAFSAAAVGREEPVPLKLAFSHELPLDDMSKWENFFSHRAADSVRELVATELTQDLAAEAVSLAHLTGLHSLTLERAPGGPLLGLGLPLLLSGMTRLTQLTLLGAGDEHSGDQHSAADTASLAQLAGLQQLTLHCYSAHWHDSLAGALTALTQLDVVQQEGDFALAACQHLTALRELSVSRPKLDRLEEADAWVTRLTALRKLTKLELERVSVPAFEELLQHCSRLERLRLRNTMTRNLPANLAAAAHLEELSIGTQDKVQPLEEAVLMFAGFDWSQLLLAPRLRVVYVDRRLACFRGEVAFDIAALNAAYRRARPHLRPVLVELVGDGLDPPRLS